MPLSVSMVISSNFRMFDLWDFTTYGPETQVVVCSFVPSIEHEHATSSSLERPDAESLI
jgi:hypothetical protein